MTQKKLDLWADDCLVTDYWRKSVFTRIFELLIDSCIYGEAC